MSIETMFLLIALVDLVAVFLAARLGKEWLLGTIVLNLVLVGLFGSKLVNIFGLVTNAGNIFYACVFFATHFLLEDYGRKEGRKTFWFGAAAVTLFVILSQTTSSISGAPETALVSGATETFFSFTPRIFFASIVAYLFAQSVNVSIYERLRAYTKGKKLWLRSNGANIVGQLVDSSIFFTIAFIDVSGPLLVQTILIGWMMKIGVVALGTPLLYAHAYLKSQK